MDENYTILTTALAEKLADEHASGTEILTLVAMMRVPPNDDGEIGLKVSGEALTSAEIAEIAHVSSDAAVRRAISGLVRKGVIKLSRTELEYGVRKAVYALRPRYVPSHLI